MAVFGIAPRFHEDEDFHLYSRRLENFFIANHIEDGGQRRAIFLSVCGQKCYHLLHDLLFPQALEETSYKNILATLEGHFKPQLSPIVERYKFNCRSQKEGESIAVYTAELRRLAVTCKYGANLDEMLRDRFICGLYDTKSFVI